MSDGEDQNDQAVIFDLRDQPEIPDAISPEFSEPRTVQRFSNGARIIKSRDSLVEEFQNALAILRVKFAQLAVGAFG